MVRGSSKRSAETAISLSSGEDSSMAGPPAKKTKKSTEKSVAPIPAETIDTIVVEAEEPAAE